MTDLVQVNYATPEDADGMFDLLLMMYSENGTFSLNEAKVRALIDQCIARDRALAGVIRVDGKPVATIGMVIESFWWTDDECLVEKFNFVHPDHRRSGFAQSQIEFAKRCSDRLSDLNLPLFIGVLSNERTEAKLRFYRRHLQAAGAFFTHNINLVEHPSRQVGS